MKPIAFVIPWYGENIPGGAETLCREVVQHLHQTGIKVEVLTTCVKEFLSDWNKDYYKAGNYEVNGVTVRRFPVKVRNVQQFDQVNYKLIHKIPINEEEEKIFFDEMINSSLLYSYIFENSNNYHCFVFLPYMFGTTYWGSKNCPKKNILLPCLHDESYANMKFIKEMMEEASGIIYNAKPEQELANKLYNVADIKSEIIGLGIDTGFSTEVNTERFRRKFKIESDFILYAGRKDAGKNVDELLRFFSMYANDQKNSVKLVLIGGGKIEIPEVLSDRVIDLGFVSSEDKYDAFSAASVFCNPSKNESFSIVIMESWLTGTPVIVNEGCDVTKNFCMESSGGLYYNSFEEFRECIDLLLSNKKLSQKMGSNGKQYVLNNYSWDVVIRKYINFFSNI